jgi:amino-acid N-acetyltransferase
MGTVTIGPATPAQFDQLAALLHASGLPVDGLRDHLDTALVALDGATVVGSAALELYGTGALLRSVAVAASHRGMGLGGRLVDAAISLAHEHGVTTLYLLTETAAPYFAARGFTPVDRQQIIGPVTNSIEFVSACPASAQAMRREA